MFQKIKAMGVVGNTASQLLRLIFKNNFLTFKTKNNGLQTFKTRSRRRSRVKYYVSRGGIRM